MRMSWPSVHTYHYITTIRVNHKGPYCWQTSTCTHVLMFHIWKHTVYWQISTTMYPHWSMRSGSTAACCTHSVYNTLHTACNDTCMYVSKYSIMIYTLMYVGPILSLSASTLTDLQVFRKQDSAEVLLPVIISRLQFRPHQPLHCKDAPPHGSRPQPSPIALPSVTIQDLSWDTVFSLYKIQGMYVREGYAGPPSYVVWLLQ